MQVITSWTGGHADALRQALRMTNESFAEHLSVSARMVANWRKRPEITPQPRVQEALDAALERASERAKAQFASLVGEAGRGTGPTTWNLSTSWAEACSARHSTLLGPSSETLNIFSQSEAIYVRSWHWITDSVAQTWSGCRPGSFALFMTSLARGLTIPS